MKFPVSFAQLSNHDLLDEVKRLSAGERAATTRLIACLMEVDARRLYLGEGCSSMFTYCTQVLRLSEHAAYGRIEAARSARRFPAILELLATGDLTLTAIGLLAPHLSAENHSALLNSARHKSKRDIEHLVAEISPRPDVRSSIRKLPAQPPATVSAALPAGASTQISGDLLRHSIPNGDPALVVDRALTLLLAELGRTRLASTKQRRASRPSKPRSRQIPAAVKRTVWTRDGGRCAFVGANGRCSETGFLQFHHVVPYARGGLAVVDNIELRCAAHNRHEAALCFGSPQPALVRERRPAYS